METHFQLCSSCEDKYKNLTFDPDGRYQGNIVPFCAITWPDEHPEFGAPLLGYDRNLDVPVDLSEHVHCRRSVIVLVGVRTHLWEQGVILAEYFDFWNEALTQLPDWPGFQRLKLNAEQMSSLKACREDLDDMMGAITEDFPNVDIHSEGGVSSFTAYRDRATEE